MPEEDVHVKWLSKAVRVVMSTGPVSREVVDVVHEVNKEIALAGGGQEVLIASVSDDWAGAGLATALRREGGALRVSGSALVCNLLPQTLTGVRKTWADDTQRGLIAGGSMKVEDWRKSRAPSANVSSPARRGRRATRAAPSSSEFGEA
jgi:hypothetical protein